MCLLRCELVKFYMFCICVVWGQVCVCSTPLLCVIQFITPREAGKDQRLACDGYTMWSQFDLYLESDRLTPCLFSFFFLDHTTRDVIPIFWTSFYDKWCVCQDSSCTCVQVDLLRSDPLWDDPLCILFSFQKDFEYGVASFTFWPLTKRELSAEKQMKDSPKLMWMCIIRTTTWEKWKP